LRITYNAIGCKIKSPFQINERGFFAEKEGFEPPEPHGSTVFKTAAIDHSATSLFNIPVLFLKQFANVAFLSFSTNHIAFF
jgi:hypothetical protein